jgi:hypothetical protein
MEDRKQENSKYKRQISHNQLLYNKFHRFTGSRVTRDPESEITRLDNIFHIDVPESEF